jgi:tripartite-type tricarboxylate transporter receptor subunit TctC
MRQIRARCDNRTAIESAWKFSMLIGPATFQERLKGIAMRHARTRLLVRSAIVALTATLAGHAAEAQTYPTRPITVIIPFAGGSASDVVTRIMLERMSRSMGQPIIVDNRPGAGGNTGTAAAAKAAPDGYTLVGSGSGPIAANRTLYRDLGYDSEKDFEAISPFALFTIIVVASAKLPVKTLPELVAYAKERPNELNYGSVGIGASQHLAGAYFEQIAGVKLTHVPYRNIAQYGPDLIAGSVPLGFQWLPNVSAPLASGGARALAVAGKTRLTALPDVPTSAEAGLPQYEISGWFMMLAPRGTPKPIVAKLNQELAAAIADPAVRERFHQQGAEPIAVSPEEAVKFIAAETLRYRDIITKAGIPQIQ